MKPIFKDPRKMGFQAEVFVMKTLGLKEAPVELDVRGIDLIDKETAYQVKWVGANNTLREGTTQSLVKGLEESRKLGYKKYVLVIVTGDSSKTFEIKTQLEVTAELLLTLKLDIEGGE